MKYAVIADIHSNSPALEEVIKYLAGENIDGFLCSGDIVGYGPYPNQCLEIVKNLKNISLVVGNHDWASIDLENIDFFNQDARQAIIWTKTELTEENKEYLRNLPYIINNEKITLVHGSLRDPLDEYLIDTQIFQANVPFLKSEISFIGHSHIPLYFCLSPEGKIEGGMLQDNQTLSLQDGYTYVLNPGSVGQPRDNNARASFGIFDDLKREFTLKRIDYSIEIIQNQMRQVGLPYFLIERLSQGV